MRLFPDSYGGYTPQDDAREPDEGPTSPGSASGPHQSGDQEPADDDELPTL